MIERRYYLGRILCGDGRPFFTTAERQTAEGAIRDIKALHARAAEGSYSYDAETMGGPPSWEVCEVVERSLVIASEKPWR